MKKAGVIRVGIGGWSFEPWRGTFYPDDVSTTQELEYASRQVTAIEINSTFYRLQSASVYAKWREATPNNFVFTVKAPRYVAQRKELRQGAAGIKRFIDSGIAELAHKLGPILWQIPPAHVLDLADAQGFFEALPAKIDGITLRHAINARHPSFAIPAFVELARTFGVAIVLEDDAIHPVVADITAPYIYARLRRCESTIDTGYAKTSLKKWAKRAGEWAAGESPKDLTYLQDHVAPTIPRDVFIYFINGAKERAPAAAKALLAQLQDLAK